MHFLIVCILMLKIILIFRLKLYFNINKMILIVFNEFAKAKYQNFYSIVIYTHKNKIHLYLVNNCIINNTNDKIIVK